MGTYLILNTSLRPKANGKVIAQRMKDRIEARGDKVELVDFGTMSIGFCIGCDGCKRTNDLIGTHKDDMTALLSRLDTSDGIALITPVYWGEISAQAKTFIDRLYAFIDFGRAEFSKASRSDKKVALIMTSRGMPEGSMDVVVGKSAAIALRTAGFSQLKSLLLSGLGNPGVISSDAGSLAQVDAVCDWLA